MAESYLIPFDQMEFHPDSEKLTSILMQKTQNTNPDFFRVLVAYYFSVAAAMMRTSVRTHDRGDIPVNAYAINLGTSGMGKGLSTSLIEEQVLREFFETFTQETLPIMAERNIAQLASERALRNGTDIDDEMASLEREYARQGPMIPIFDSGTEAAVKQARHKLLLANAGSLNLQIEEIGSKLLGQTEVLTTFLELYDVGRIKQKLVKNTNENIRSEEIPGRTAANMLLFGTPSKLLNGDKVEDEFLSMLDTGFARRCLYGYVRNHSRDMSMSVQEVYSLHTSKNSNQFLQDIGKRFAAFANIINANKALVMQQDVALALIEYRLLCERRAEVLPEHEEMRKAEMSHRYFKALKVAGAYAFADDSPEVTKANLFQAIKLVEVSGESFEMLMKRERNYAKLARYIASVGHPLTQADLVEDLPFYKGSLSQRNEMMTLAIAFGYQNNIIIKKSFDDGIEFLRGESLEETDLSKITLSYSQDLAFGYTNEEVPFSDMHKLTQTADYHWTNHHLLDGHRLEEKAIAGFNTIVLDIDGTTPINVLSSLLKDYKFLLYTTKSHAPDNHCYRVVIPISHRLRLDQTEFKEFMNNVYEWLPFSVDDVTGQRARKWASHNGQYQYNEGQLLDILPFIPKTSKNEQRRKILQDQQQLDNLERWVINNTGDGNRNNQLMRYAMILVDAGADYNDVSSKVQALNDKLADKLDELEIMKTIMVTAGKAIAKRDA